ncbi:FIG007785: exported protein [hydrothermal vent metagenome]|uniref:FIG007785: exported protein n=1 Tax=hydrothermal vent metagenome TaxID=652676 RepID=A0A3B0UBF8_9ZZZZ
MITAFVSRPARAMTGNFWLIFKKAMMGAMALLLISLTAACADENTATIITANGPVSFKVELATTQSERARGLMFRQELAVDAGMLFDFGEEREVAFWMRNTFIPLDMIFIAADGTIKSIHPNARPQDSTAIPSQFPVRFVLEIPGGRAAAAGIRVGDRLEHPLVQKP